MQDIRASRKGSTPSVVRSEIRLVKGQTGSVGCVGRRDSVADDVDLGRVKGADGSADNVTPLEKLVDAVRTDKAGAARDTNDGRGVGVHRDCEYGCDWLCVGGM